MHIPLSYQALRRIYLFSVIIVASTSNAQINFESGYFIDEGMVKTECLIKNMDWDDNPTEFKYKLSDTGSFQTGSIATVSEFGVYGSFRYVKADVKIDRSPTNLNELNSSKEPFWSQEKLFLKVLISGKASLYAYTGEKNIERYFYSVPGKSIQQLIFKQFYVSSDKINSNTDFRKQLWIDVRCEKTPKKKIETINYNKKEITKYFRNYNACIGDTSVEYEKKINSGKEMFNLSVTPGLNFASATFGGNYSQDEISYDFKSKPNLRIGFEAEFILPFNKNKWGIILEPYYKSYNDLQLLNNTDTLSINYKAIELSAGIRHYFFLNKNTKLFVNVMVNSGLRLNFNSTIVYYDYYQPLHISSSFNYAVGAGIAHKRFFLECRYYTRQNILSDYTNYYCSYNSFNIIIGYKFLKVKA